MEEVKNITQDEVLEIIKDFPIEPTRNKVIVTVNVEEVDPNNIDLSGNSFAEQQYVIATGAFSKDFKPGQKVLLDIRKMEVPNSGGQIEIDPIEVDGRIYAFINDGIIKAKDNR